MNTTAHRLAARQLCAALTLLALAACSSDGGTTPSASGSGVRAVRLNPASSELGLGGTLQLKLIALDAQENEVPGSAVVWVSADTNIAAVSQDGLVTARKIGVVQLQAASDGRSAFSVISVVAPRVAAVTITPGTPTVQAGATVQLAARLTDGGGAALPDRLVFWQSSNDAVARVTSTGLVNGVVAGSATITATSEGKSATVQVTVTAAPASGGTTPPTTGGGSTPTTPTPPTTPAQPATPAPTTARVDVAPGTASLLVGRTQQLTATARDAAGAARTGRTFAWTSSASGVATVNSSGLVTAVGPGTATITARADGVTGTATITVTGPAPVARVEVTPTGVKLFEEDDDGPQTAVLTATLFDAGNSSLAGRSCSWSGGKRPDGKGAPVVTIETLTPTTVRVVAKNEGKTIVTATCEGRSASAAVEVVEED